MEKSEDILSRKQIREAIITIKYIINVPRIHGYRDLVQYLSHKCNVSGHYPSSCFYLKAQCFNSGLCLRLQSKPTQLDPIDRASPYRRRLGPTEYVLPEDGDIIQSPKRYVLNKNRTMDNVQRNIFTSINVSSSPIFRSYFNHSLKFISM
jgi:hypothetical protein